ncbi:TAM-1 protein [Aphelenchoides avenae]|nr:TAM-1 protein [Aphelenchus avenae]
MDLSEANLAKTLECPVCLDVFDEPKLLNCGHTVCQKCVKKAAKTRRTTPDGSSAGYEQKCVKCPECIEETTIPPDGLKTNYRLVDLVCRAQKPMVDCHACNGCRKHALIAEMFTCETCQETLKNKPLWFCALCVVKQHHGHTVSDCNKATRQQIVDACQGIASSGSLADIYIGLTMSHLNGALEKAELISQLLNCRRRGFSTIEKRVKRADDTLTQEDLATSLQAATDLKRKFENASTTANQVGKDLESVLQNFHRELKELLKDATDDADANQ